MVPEPHNAGAFILMRLSRVRVREVFGVMLKGEWTDRSKA